MLRLQAVQYLLMAGSQWALYFGVMILLHGHLFVGVTWLQMPDAKKNFPGIYDPVKPLTSMDILIVWVFIQTPFLLLYN